MKGMGGLIKNEIIKLWKQKGYKIVIFIMLGFMIIAPAFNVLISSIISFDTAEYRYEEALDWASDYEETEPIYAEYYTAEAEAYKFFLDNDLGDSWKYEIYGIDYVNDYLYVAALELIVEGTYSAQKVNEVFYIYNEEEIEDFEAEYELAKAELKAFENNILTMTEKKHYEQYIFLQEAAVASAELKYDSAKALYLSNPENEIYRYEYDLAATELDAAKLELKALNLLSKKSADPNGWQYYIFKNELSFAIDNYIYYVPMSRSEYEEYSAGAFFSDYSDYVKECEEGSEYYKNEINKYIYAIENDIKMTSEYSDSLSAKRQSRGQMESFISNMTIVMMIMVAGCIAKEFSSGTVRLLLIRPRTRTQIIISKLLAVMIIFGVLVAAASIIISLEYMLFLGIGDMFAPDIIMLGESIIELPFIVGSILTVLVALLPACAYISIAAVLATATKKSGISITLSILINVLVLNIILGIAIAFIELLPSVFSWLAYTPIAYFDMTFSMGNAFTWEPKLWLGVIYHLAFIAITVWLTILSYKKAQVKG